MQAAWDQVSILRSVDDPRAWPVLSERIAAATALYGTGELFRGAVLLIDVALTQIDTGARGREQFNERFTRTLMNKIAAQGVEAVEQSDLSMVHQVVTISLEGRDPVAWRDQAGPVPDSEPCAMGCALALIADFVDLVGGPGACERVLLSSLGDALD